MVTSLPSHYFRLTLSLSHRLYLTHNIGSASALPIIQLKQSFPLYKPKVLTGSNSIAPFVLTQQVHQRHLLNTTDASI